MLCYDENGPLLVTNYQHNENMNMSHSKKLYADPKLLKNLKMKNTCRLMLSLDMTSNNFLLYKIIIVVDMKM